MACKNLLAVRNWVIDHYLGLYVKQRHSMCWTRGLYLWETTNIYILFSSPQTICVSAELHFFFVFLQ
uniref:Uncharacterized protein n=1 Tax=Rhizophora mucronata TaxID=61149 RepID=A0A2P2PH48_RHIMU